uniref:NAD(P)-binding domain-containing protein n=1 Tax=Mycena chlorophos TaxID=658473 RepID=A0ABQ0M3K0_MYCCL|nr:predicted protein [Mycena chlorophos]
MAHIILVGATGTVGNGVLRAALASDRVSKVSILSRREFTLPEINREKAQIILQTDYTQYPDSVLERLKGADACIWAQGVSQNAVNEQDYLRITFDFPVASAKAFSSLSDKGHFNFVHVSGEGADPAEKAWSLYGKIKGRAERVLRELTQTEPYTSLRVYNVRPALVAPAPGHQSPALDAHIATKHVIVGALRLLRLERYVSPTDTMGKVFLDLALGDGEPIPAGPGVGDSGYLVTSLGIRKLEK